MELSPPQEETVKNLVRSCITCAKAKAKCVKNAGADKCERCARLKKDCQSKEPVLRRKKIVKTTRAAQLEKLESKIEHLVNTLSSNPQSHHSNRSFEHGQPSPPISQASSSSVSQDSITVTHRSTEVLDSLCPESSRGSKPPGIDDSPHETAVTAITLSEADTLLDRYRRLMSTGMPFVLVPKDATATSLYEQKPLLLRAICTVSKFHDLPQQQALVKQLVKEIGNRVMGEGEKSIDIIQAILVFAAWYHPHVFWCHQVTNLLHLAIAMTIDMGINRSSSAHEFKTAVAKAAAPHPKAPRESTLEDRRCLLGIFYMTSMLAASFKKCDVMTFTPYMEDCLTVLEQAHEHDSDIFLVQFVRVQQVINSIINIDNETTAPSRVYIKAFQADLERLKRNSNIDNIYYSLQFLAAEILMWELSLTNLQDGNRAVTPKNLPTHLEDLYRCVAAIRAFLDVWVTIPSSAYYLLPFSVFGQFAHAFIVLTKLASFEFDGWDLKALNEQINFLSVIDESALAFEAATESTPDGIPVNNESFGKWAQRVRWMRQVYESKFAADGTAVAAVPEQTPSSSTSQWEQIDYQQQLQTPPITDNNSGPPDPAYMNADFFNYLDENFWQSFSLTDFDLTYPAMNPQQMGLTGNAEAHKMYWGAAPRM